MPKGFAHEIAADFKRVSQKLGRTPTRDEFIIESPFFEEVFGSYTALAQACGAWEKGTTRQNKQAIRKEKFQHLKKEVEERKSLITPPKIVSRLLCISDMHKPYGHPDTNAFLKALHEKYFFDHILIGGDEIDSHAMSFHDHDPNLPSPGHELEQAINQLQELYEIFPQADVLESNHGSLFYRKGKHHGFPRQVLKSYNEILKAPRDWTWRPEFTYQFSNGKKAIAHHGYSANALLAAKKRGASAIFFHFHSLFSIQYWQNLEGAFWAMQCGCLVDDTSLAMEYNKLTIERPIIGVGAVFDGHPRLFHMPLDKGGRWNGVVP